MSSGYIQSRDHPSFLSDNPLCMYVCTYACVYVCIIQREFVYAHVNLWPPVLDSILRNFPADAVDRVERHMYPGVECAASRKTTSATQPSWVGEKTGAGIVEGGVAKGVKVRFRLLRFQFVMRGGEGRGLVSELIFSL